MAAKPKTFIVLYYAPASAVKKMMSTPPEHAAEGMKLWMAWAKKCGKKLVDLGAPLGQGVKVDSLVLTCFSERTESGHSLVLMI